MEKDNIICYFSGTGNSYWAALKVAEKLSECELIDIAKFDYNEKLMASRVGIFYPVYYWGIPNIIRKFASNANIEADYIFELHTMGGYDGVATRQLIECLKANVNSNILKASYRIKMPNNIALINKSNLITDVYRIPDDHTISKFFHKAETALQDFVPAIISKEPHYYSEPFYYRPWRNYGYKLNEQFCSQITRKGQEFAEGLESSCTGCGKCSKACPVNNITMKNNKPLWGTQCEFCLACLHACPTNAINTGFSKGKKRYHNPML